MARPQKHTVDYLPHNADTSNSHTITILENNFSTEGYSTGFKLLERISMTENHIISCRNNEDTEFLAAKLKLAPRRMMAILNKMAELNFIDFDLWQSRIIWCQDLINRLEPVYDNRKQQKPTMPNTRGCTISEF